MVGGCDVGIVLVSTLTPGLTSALASTLTPARLYGDITATDGVISPWYQGDIMASDSLASTSGQC